jgi:hypothetical protein
MLNKLLTINALIEMPVHVSGSNKCKIAIYALLKPIYFECLICNYKKK